jgi:hypothetical protein
LEHDRFPLLKLKMLFFVQECSAELPFLPPVKVFFQKFSFFLQILSPIWLCAILCAHAILCAPTVLAFAATWGGGGSTLWVKSRDTGREKTAAEKVVISPLVGWGEVWWG